MKIVYAFMAGRGYFAGLRVTKRNKALKATRFYFLLTLTLFQAKHQLQSNRIYSCEQHCNIVPQYCNFDRQIAEQFATDALSSAEPYEFLVKLRNITWETNYVIFCQNALPSPRPSRTTKCPLLSLHYPYNPI